MKFPVSNNLNTWEMREWMNLKKLTMKEKNMIMKPSAKLLSANSQLLRLSSAHPKPSGQCTCYQAPLLWNTLPCSLQHSSSIATFKSALKAHLFSSALWMPCLCAVVCSVLCVQLCDQRLRCRVLRRWLETQVLNVEGWLETEVLNVDDATRDWGAECWGGYSRLRCKVLRQWLKLEVLSVEGVTRDWGAKRWGGD